MTLMEREFEENTPSSPLCFMYYWWKYLKRVDCISISIRVHFNVEDAIQNFIMRTHAYTHER